MTVGVRSIAPMDLRGLGALLRGAPGKTGALFGSAVVFAAAVGMLEAFDARVLMGPWISVSDAIVVLLGLGAGSVAGRPPPPIEGFTQPPPGALNVVSGAVAGLMAGLVVNLFVLILVNVNIRDIFVAFTPRLADDLMVFGRPVGVAMVIWLAAGAVLGALGAASHLLTQRLRRAVVLAVAWVLVVGMLQIVFAQVLDGLAIDAAIEWIYRGTTGGMEPLAALVIGAAVVGISLAGRGRVRALPQRVVGMPPPERRIALLVGALIAVLVLAALPQVLGNFLSAALGLAGTFLLMALGLNIVIGFAGLLDLGYVAFFAVGAYTTAVLTSPTAPAFSPELIFWAAIPFIVLAAAIAGLIVGTPVLRMRGDYLAIVTLGFGEIARLIVLSDWQKGSLGGAQGIRRIPPISLFGQEFVEPETFFYIIMAFVILFTYITYALQRSRLGRAWNAMREDEPVAEAMGVNVVAAKLWAFVLGAIMASLGGALFATKVTAVFPSSFNIIVSITVVVIVIVGGMGSVPGVVLASFVLIALPELLREFEEFKFLLYGILLIFMMLKRPEGFIPSRRRQRELREDERAQDAWFRGAEPAPDEPTPAEGT